MSGNRLLEHDIQCAFVDWLGWNSKRYPGVDLGFAVPNGSLRHPAVAGKLKAEGVRKGVPDFWFPCPRNGKSGLVIEFKRPDGPNPSGDQLIFIRRLRAEGWQVDVCFSTEQAITSVERYFRER